MVNRRKCGTCRFYQEARLASSGWCHHPQRKVSSDLMIMVRKNELACRDEWAHDLWEPAEPGAAGGLPFSGHPADSRMAPATEQEIAALLRTEAPPSPTGGTTAETKPDDVLLSELGVPEPPVSAAQPEPSREQRPATNIPAPYPPAEPRVSETSIRNAIIKAREAHRERQRLAAIRASEVTPLTGGEPAPTQSGAAMPLTPAASGALSEQEAVGHVASRSSDTEKQIDEIDRDLASAGGPGQEPYQARDKELDTVEFEPEPPSATEHDVPLRPAARQPANLPAAPTERELPDWLTAGPATQRSASRRETTHVPSREQLTSANAGMPSGSAAEEWPWRDEPAPLAAPQSALAAGNSTDDASWEADELSWRDDASDDRAPAPFAARAKAFDELDDLGGDDRSDNHVVAGDDDVDIRRVSGIAAHLDRVCRNCRDFRPAETGERGWCANQWAFSHRRMVDADERTPCETSLGDWWLPVDEVWSGAADVSSHGQPTPLIDAWLVPQHERVPTRRRS